jgi:hypothetical protein
MNKSLHEPNVEIGGYFGLDLPDYGNQFVSAIKFQSCRAALRAALESANIKRVLLPAYICNSVIQAVADAGAYVKTYELDDSLYPTFLPNQSFDSYTLLYVNYFGLCQDNVDRLHRDIPGKNLIIDNSQALFAPPTNALATVYSPRKFVGAPDGGLLVASSLGVIEPESEDTGSVDRMRHLYLRMAYSAQDGYHAFLEAENTLGNTEPLRMSRLTKRILNSIDLEAVKRRRRENYLALAAQLDKYNRHKWVLGPESVPLCYPLLVDMNVENLKSRLAKRGIYIPTYWPESIGRAQQGSIGQRLINCCLAVPCDQRYSPGQMSYLADEIISGYITSN